MIRVGYLLIATGHLVLLVFMLRLLRPALRLRMYEVWVLVALLIGLVYDNTILGLGTTIGEGDLLHNLSVPRFVTHALLTPTLMVFAAASAARMGVPGYRSRRRFTIWSVITVVAVVYGCIAELGSLHLVAKTESGVLRYTHADALVPIATIATVIGLIVIGFAMTRKARWPWVFATSLAMFVIAGTIAGTGLITNGGELVMLAAMVATAWEAYRRYSRELAGETPAPSSNALS